MKKSSLLLLFLVSVSWVMMVVARKTSGTFKATAGLKNGKKIEHIAANPISTNSVFDLSEGGRRRRRRIPINSVVQPEKRMFQQSKHQQSLFEDESKSAFDHLESFASQGKDVLKSLFRTAKMMRSSSFEALLLKATWPDDNPVSEIALYQIFQELVPYFEEYAVSLGKAARDKCRNPTHLDTYSGCDDPYYMTNHKLYMKMTETDWRTTLKALLIYLSIFHESSASACSSFRKAMHVMKHRRALKYQSDHYNYFDRAMISRVESDDESLRGFVSHVVNFVLHRAGHYTQSYNELNISLHALKVSNENKVEALSENFVNIANALKTAQTNLILGLSCKLPESLSQSGIALQIYRLIAKDVITNWALLSEHISTLRRVHTMVLDIETAPVDKLLKSKKSFEAFLKFHNQASKQIQKFCSVDRQTLKLYRRTLNASDWRCDDRISRKDKDARRINMYIGDEGGTVGNGIEEEDVEDRDEDDLVSTILLEEDDGDFLS